MADLDLNADLGEAYSAGSMDDDEALLGIITSANVACGFHAGDPLVMQRTCAAAVARGVVIGAHVSYADRAGFGRVPMQMPADQLRAEVSYQIAALAGMADVAGGRVRYVKPHGALYNTIITDRVQATAVVDAVADHGLTLMTQPGAAAEEARRRGVEVVIELFADRAYTADGRLVARSEPGSVIEDPDQIVSRVRQFLAGGTMPTIDGGQVQVPARSVCVHGDTPGAVAIARAVRSVLVERGGPAPFVP